MRKRLIIVLFFATLHSASFSAFAGFDDGDAASKGGYAYPAINVTSTQTLNAALQGFAEAQRID